MSKIRGMYRSYCHDRDTECRELMTGGNEMEDFKDFLEGLPHNENARFAVYNDVSKFSVEDKGTVRNIIFKAYSQGGKQGTDYAVFYFKEIIDQCDLANARIQI